MSDEIEENENEIPERTELEKELLDALREISSQVQEIYDSISAEAYIIAALETGYLKRFTDKLYMEYWV